MELAFFAGIETNNAKRKEPKHYLIPFHRVNVVWRAENGKMYFEACDGEVYEMDCEARNWKAGIKVIRRDEV